MANRHFQEGQPQNGNKHDDRLLIIYTATYTIYSRFLCFIVEKMTLINLFSFIFKFSVTKNHRFHSCVKSYILIAPTKHNLMFNQIYNLMFNQIYASLQESTTH